MLTPTPRLNPLSLCALPLSSQVDPKTDGAARDWVAIFDECRSVLLQEIDYTNEGRNAEQFRENFAGQPWVKVPEIVWDKSGQRVLTMEYCPGLKINRVEEIQSFGLDRELLARYSVESYLQQILRYGFFHADPHPGNIAVDAGECGWTERTGRRDQAGPALRRFRGALSAPWGLAGGCAGLR